jgi:hypothetical protein
MKIRINNWRNEEEYSDLDENTPLSVWAWQFLRRNLSYQEEWLLEAEAYKIRRKEFFSKPQNPCHLFGSQDETDEEVLSATWFTIFSPAEEKSWNKGLVAYSEAAKKWHLLAGYKNPHSNYPPAFDGEVAIFIGGKDFPRQDYIIGHTVPDGKYALVLDPNLDFDMQLETARKDLHFRKSFDSNKCSIPKMKKALEKPNIVKLNNTLLQKRENRKVKRNWKLYLRILDSQIDVASTKLTTAEVVNLLTKSSGQEDKAAKYQELRKQALKLTKDYHSQILGF